LEPNFLAALYIRSLDSTPASKYIRKLEDDGFLIGALNPQAISSFSRQSRIGKMTHCSWLLMTAHPRAPGSSRSSPYEICWKQKHQKSSWKKRQILSWRHVSGGNTGNTPPQKKQRPKGSLDPQKWLFWGPKHPCVIQVHSPETIGGSKILRGESKLIITKRINQPGPFCWRHHSTDFTGAFLNKELPGDFPDFPPSITFQGSQKLIFGKAKLGDSKWICFSEHIYHAYTPYTWCLEPLLKPVVL